jgi:iron complex transport system substrate-binding protein
MRICSFLPSATEILCAIGLQDSIAGISFECDYPPEVRSKPVVVYTRLLPALAPAEIDRQVNETVRQGKSLYRIEVEKLKQIQPDLVITQDLCHVCAASSEDLRAATTVLPPWTRVISLSPHRLSDIWQNILSIGDATGRQAEAAIVVEKSKQRIDQVQKALAYVVARPRVLCLEWLDPPFIAGHWVPEMVELAGGTDVLGRRGEPGFRTNWDDVLGTDPQIIVIMPCGYDLERNTKELRSFAFPDGWRRLRAVRNRRVFAVNSSGYFSRPGPRVATGVEMLARIIHPARVSLDLPAGAVATVKKYASAA